MIIERLHERHLPLVDAFSCTETSEMLADLKADERRRVSDNIRGNTPKKWRISSTRKLSANRNWV